MAEGVFLKWINDCLEGNSANKAELNHDTPYTVPYQGVTSFTVHSEMTTGYVSTHRPSSSISGYEAAKRQDGASPAQSQDAQIQNSPVKFLAQNGRWDIPGWTFSETREVTCHGCGGRRQVQCNGCSGSGQRNCGNCGGQGSQICVSCGGRGTRPDVYSGLTDARGMMRSSSAPTCFACTNGRQTCRACGGSRRVRCQSCSGSGKVTCIGCHGRGILVQEKIKTYFAKSSVSKSLDSKQPDHVKDFIAGNWASLVRKGYFSVVRHERQSLGHDDGCWKTVGRVTVHDQAYKIGRRKVPVMLAGIDSGSIGSMVYDCPAFLDDEIGIERLAKLAPAKALLALSKFRIGRDSIDLWESVKRGDDRIPAVTKALNEIYGAAVSGDAISKITQIIKKGLPRIRGAKRRNSWIDLIFWSFPVGILLMSLMHVTANFFPNPDYPDQTLPVVPYFGAAALIWLLVGGFLVKNSVKKLGKKIGLQGTMRAKQGGWWLIGPTLSLFSMVGGVIVGFVLVSFTMLYSTFWNPILREQAFDLFESYSDVLPTVGVQQTTSDVNLRVWPDPDSRIERLLKKGGNG